MNVHSNPHPANDPVVAPQSWHDANRAVNALGIDWLRGMLAGERPSREAFEGARAALRAAGTPAAIDRLSALFQLAPFDEDLLLLALAALTDAGVAVACAERNGRAAADYPVAGLALALLAPDPEAAALAWPRLSPDAPLRRFRLIDNPVGAMGLRTPLLLGERIAQVLAGEDGDDARIRPMLSDPGPALLPDRLRDAIAVLAAEVSAARRPLVVVTGPVRSGRRAAARALAAEFGLGLAAFRPLPFEPAHDLLPVLAREAALGGFALLVDPEHPETRRLLDDRIDALTIAVASGGHDLPFDTPQLRLGPLGHGDRAALWRASLGGRAERLDPGVDALADQFRLGPSEIAAAAASDEPWAACREQAGHDLGRLADRLTPQAGWDDLVLPAEIVEALRAVTAQVRDRAVVHNDFGFDSKLARGGGVTVLLAGPSGVGKTMAAEVMAGDLGLDLFRIDLSRVVSKFIGETEKNLGAVFDAAATGGAVLFFDEADALFGKRSEVKDSHDRYANIETSYLLQRMESFPGLAILATNMKANLDSAFLRRLRFVIDLPLPDAAQRRTIWEKAFPAATPTEALDWEALARLEVAGGNVAVMAVNAAFFAAAEAAPVGMHHIARAARAEFRKLDREFNAHWPERRR